MIMWLSEVTCREVLRHYQMTGLCVTRSGEYGAAVGHMFADHIFARARVTDPEVYIKASAQDHAFLYP